MKLALTNSCARPALLIGTISPSTSSHRQVCSSGSCRNCSTVNGAVIVAISIIISLLNSGIGIACLYGEEYTMADKQKGMCAHPACNCPVPEGEKYCSQYCKDAAD